MGLRAIFTITILSLLSLTTSVLAEEPCLELYKKQAEENRQEYRKHRDRYVHGEVTLSGSGQTIMLPNANITFAGESEHYEYRNDEQIALELLYSEDILRITDGEAYKMLTHIQEKLSDKDNKVSIADIQKYIKQGFLDSEFCKDGKVKKSAGQIIRYAKRELKNQRIMDKPRNPSPPKQLADDFNSERDVAGKKKNTNQN